MRKLIASEWLTLDGVFDSDPEYFDRWFTPYHSESRAAHIQQSILGCGAMLMGRNTYNALAPYWSSLRNNEMGIADKMNAAPKYVVSTTLETAEWQNTKRIISDNVAEEIARLKQMPGNYVLIPGSATLVESLVQADLIDEFRFLVHPVMMGEGKRFFKDGMETTELELVSSDALDLGVIANRYALDSGQ